MLWWVGGVWLVAVVGLWIVDRGLWWMIGLWLVVGGWLVVKVVGL